MTSSPNIEVQPINESKRRIKRKVEKSGGREEGFKGGLVRE